MTKEIGIRLSVKDKEVAERALRAFGSEGQAALQKIEAAARPASTNLLAVSSAASFGRSAFFGLASGAIAAVASYLSLSQAIRGTRDALDAMSEIADRSKSTGLDVELLQEVTYHAELAGVSYEELSGSLETFIRNAGLAEVGKGKMVAALKALNPELLRNIQLATTQEERLRLAADAINDAGSASEKAAISTALFGANGARMVEVFSGGAAALEATAAKARELGIIIDRELIARADELGDEFDTAAKVIDINLKSALVNLAPTIVWLVGRAGDLARAFNIVIDQFKDVEDRTFVRPLQNQLGGIYEQKLAAEEELARMRSEAAPGMDALNALNFAEKEARIEQLAGEADRLLARITQLQGEGQTPEVVPPSVDIPDLPTSEGAKKALNDAERLIERVRTASEEYRATLQKLNEMQSAGLISQETFNRATGDAAIKFAGAAEGAAEYEAAQGALEQALRQGMVTEAEYTKAVEAMTERRLASSKDWATGMERGLRRIAKDGADIGKSVEETLVGAASSFEDALVSAFKTGKLEWDDLANAIAEDAVRLAIRQGISGAAGFLGNLFTGGTGGAGAGFVGGGSDSWGSLVPNANGNVFSGPGISAYSGRIVDRPTLFPFAKGVGLFGEDGPEAIIPLKRGADGKLGVGASGSGVESPVEVHVHPTAGQTAEIRETRDNRGRRRVDVVLNEAVASAVATPRGPTQQALSSVGVLASR